MEEPTQEQLDMAGLEEDLDAILAEGRICLERWGTEERLPEIPNEFFCLLQAISGVLIERGEDVADLRHARWG